MHILIAPNAFKNSLSAHEAAKCIETGLKQSRLSCTTQCFPIADGGDGTGELIAGKFKGKTIQGNYHDAQGKLITSSFSTIGDGHTAIIEMAAASGLRLLDQRALNPMVASSRGTGEMVKAALDLGVKKIIITVGGSATVDGGCGILHALGVAFFDRDSRKLDPVPQQLMQLHSIDISAMDERIGKTEIEIWCDVQNTLLGEHGAAAVFGPQKGATPAQVLQLNGMLANLAAITKEITGVDTSQLISGGAAGGVAASMHAFFQATLCNGIDSFLALTLFDDVLEKSDLVITGEGQIDMQTLQGKGPYGIAKKAKEKNIPVIALAGKVPIDDHPALTELFPVLLPIGHQPLPLEDLIKLTDRNLIRMARQIGNLLAINYIEE